MRAGLHQFNEYIEHITRRLNVNIMVLNTKPVTTSSSMKNIQLRYPHGCRNLLPSLIAQKGPELVYATL